ncbi:Rpn family recombination-promoting nuclease/putative transposase, partial [Providencia rettgeri]
MVFFNKAIDIFCGITQTLFSFPYTQLWTECFPLPEIAHELYTQPFPLVDITVIDDNELVNHRKIAVMELAMKHK